MTQAISVRCQNCGSPLQVSENVRFVTCAYCHSELQVVRDASAVHTEVLQRIEQNSEKTVNHLKVIEIQNEIERLDREWEMWREKNLSRDKNGVISEPFPPLGKRAVFIGAGIVAGFFLILAGLTHAWGLFLSAAAIIPSLLILAGFSRESDARSYQAAQARYESWRKELLHKLDRVRQ
jgi:hypothetical protein